MIPLSAYTYIFPQGSTWARWFGCVLHAGIQLPTDQFRDHVLFWCLCFCVFVCVCFFETPLTYVLQVSRQAYHALHGLFGTDFEFRRASQVFADRFDTP